MRSFQDNVVLTISTIAPIVDSKPEDSIEDQERKLHSFVSDGSSGFPTRLVDVLCNCVAYLEHKAHAGLMTPLEQRFKALLKDDESIFAVHDFAFSDSSPTRFMGNTTAHPRNRSKLDVVRRAVTRSARKEEITTASRCAVAMSLPQAELLDMQLKEEEEANRLIERKKYLNSDNVKESRYDIILSCLDYHRKIMETKPKTWSKRAMF